ncbi:phosphodiester glycosidase family protein [Weissella confusa]|uniref:Exopolysaccharide biosynthesis protein n=1 Tax=Weissella confusa TaxID=1583 RepID=A0A4Z0RYR8_WEICO|nr:phosphodiester glycosidase family protein [Weissella confusa]TGE71761.1 exopolysaccharide biosynthesis protein [Weissella confusa]
MKRKLTLVTSAILTVYTSFTLVDTFMLQHSGTAIATSTQTVKTTAKKDSSTVKKTATYYEDSHMSINVTTERVDGTTVYVADITVDDPSLLQTALANNTYGRNYTEKTSSMASEHNAIFTINGDYYGFRDTGYVVRNGTLYRDTVATDTDALVIDSDGNMKSVNQSDETASELLKNGAQQVLSFGPTLVENGKVTVSEDAEVGQSQASNPRTAIGQVGKNHYVVVVSDGRTSESTGLSLYQLANVMKSHGATYAYNLDGGGSSTMVLNGKVINNPVGGSGQSSERAVSDMLYFGYSE